MLSAYIELWMHAGSLESRREAYEFLEAQAKTMLTAFPSSQTKSLQLV